MSFYEHFSRIIAEELEKRDTLENVIARIKGAAKTKKIGFFPNSRLSAIILREIREKYPKVLKSVVGCFSTGKSATTEIGIPVYQKKDFDTFKDISFVVMASGTFNAKDERDLKKFTHYSGEVLKTSSFQITLPTTLTNEQILDRIKEVYHSLADDKSQATYMTAWLSRMLNDETLTHIFQAEHNIDETTEPIVYRGHEIKGLDHTCKKELQSELYVMKEVFPEKGDVVLDLGAYKGDTAIFFADSVGKDGKVYAFEPVMPNLKVLIENSRENGFENVIVPVNAGISSKSGKMKVIYDGESIGVPWAYLDDKRGNEVEITTIDDFIKTRNLSRIDYIKMDVEGVEEEAITGARETIAKMKPKMAIAAYHKTSDLFVIPELIRKFADYSVYMRSKVEGSFGFTFYFKPRGK